MRRPILAYYILFVILFISEGYSLPQNKHSLYVSNAGSLECLIPQSQGFSSATQYGGVLDQGLYYAHSSGFISGVQIGFGYYDKGISDEYAVYRGFNYYKVGVGAGYWGKTQNFAYFGLLDIEGYFSQYDASVQQFFFPALSLTGGIGLGRIHKIFLTLPIKYEFRNDLSFSGSIGLGVKTFLDASFPFFSNSLNNEEEE